MLSERVENVGLRTGRWNGKGIPQDSRHSEDTDSMRKHSRPLEVMNI